MQEFEDRLRKLAPDTILAAGAEQFDAFYTRILHRFTLKHVPEAEADDVVQNAWLSSPLKNAGCGHAVR